MAAFAATLCLLTTSLRSVEAVDKSLSILSLNLYLLPAFDLGQGIRAQRIAEASFTKGHDVVVFQECFEYTACSTVVNGLKHEYPFYTNVIGNGDVGTALNSWDSSNSGGLESLLKVANGGVRIMSKWPIIEKHQHFYKEGCGSDALAKKGFAYVKLSIEGSMVHIIGTHAQSTDSARSAPNKIPANQLVVLAGDFNVDRYSSDREYGLMLNTLNARPADTFKGHTTTWDPQTNELIQANHEYSQEPAQYID
ncbi:hypothetical protein BGZ73_005441 [Actinomortierella ambigua]|nr:hypothetical protein BGZ73_005441 [Actinomortierella ambigua]